MLTRIRNAINVGKREVSMPHSKIKEAVATQLKKSGFVSDIKTVDASMGKDLKVVITSDGEPARITQIARMSKPGRRHYASAADIPIVMRGRGVVVVSTSKGIMTGAQAKKFGIGGELICKVY
jgi:small subunit ribosomal protein S8